MSPLLSILTWAAWSPGLESPVAWRQWAQAGIVAGTGNTAPALEALTALQRRRLSPLTRLALHVTANCQQACRADFIIFVSRHGDLARSTGILRDLAARETPSPTAFSTSVHNAVAGLYSILYQDDTPSTSIAAGRNGFAQAWLEACGRLYSDEARRVLIVSYDNPPCEPYTRWSHCPEQPFAVGVTLTRADHNHPACLPPESVAARAGQEENDALLFLGTFLRSGDADLHRQATGANAP